MSYAPVNNTIVFAGTKDDVTKFINIGLDNSKLPSMKDDDFDKWIGFLMRNARHYEKDRSISETFYYFLNGLTMDTFLPLPDDYRKTASNECEYNFKVRFGCDFDAEINSMCLSIVNGYYTIELTIETNNCPPELWVKQIKDKVGFKFAFIHAADYDENCFNYFKEIDDNDDHEYKEKLFEIEAEAEDDDAKDDMIDSLNERILDCFSNYIQERTKD
jgi:hypothetical protein